jgi:DNA-directed RNA polymerase subunit RPC12/RpoP
MTNTPTPIRVADSDFLLTFDMGCSILRPTIIGGVSMQAYCMKCRKKVEIQNAKSITMKNKRPATQGVCPKCGTKVFRIGKS